MHNLKPAITHIAIALLLIAAANQAHCSARVGVAYNSTIADAVSDPDSGDTLTFSKIEGPAWLTVADNGDLTGTPAKDDKGTNEFVVSVEDDAGARDMAMLFIFVKPAKKKLFDFLFFWR